MPSRDIHIIHNCSCYTTLLSQPLLSRLVPSLVPMLL